MLSALLWLIIVAIILGLIIWLAQQIPGFGQFAPIIRVVCIVVFIVYVIYLLMGFVHGVR